MTIQITDTELKELVRSACEQAAEQAVNSYIAKLAGKQESVQTGKVENVSDEDIKNMMDVMRANMACEYDPEDEEWFLYCDDEDFSRYSEY